MPPKKEKSSQSGKAMAERSEQHGLGHYKTLAEQFYESLLLLKALSGLRDSYEGLPGSQNLRKERLRNFLRGLAYFCDFKKGGDYYTGIGLEETETEYIFWVASNKQRPELADFLKDVLKHLKELKDAPKAMKGHLRRNLQEMCFTKSAKRIDMYQTHLVKSIKDAQSILDTPKTQHDRELSSWISGLLSNDGKDNVELCDSMFTASKENHMLRLLRSRAKFERSLQNSRGKRNAFDEIRHYIGRLASHSRTHNQLCDDVEDPLIEEIIFAPLVRQIDPPNQAEPTYDIHTTLKGLLVGIKDDDERREVENRLDNLNRQCEIFEVISNQYSNFKPRVHAEVQILEHFYRNNLKFANHDKFVGGSKPSCECCYLYFKHHPARMVLPESSHKVFLNWSLPPVANPHSEDPKFIQQRKILSKMVNVLVYDAISQVLDCRTVPCLRPDSLTDLSSTIASFRLMELDEKSSLSEKGFFGHRGWDFYGETSSVANYEDGSDTEIGGVFI